MAQAKRKSSDTDLLINREWCKGCGICIAFCPKEALFIDEEGKAEKDMSNCTSCGVCETYCPDFAIAVVKRRLNSNAGEQTGSDARQ